MNNASPFQPAAEEGFTIRELSILLPPQLIKSEGLPPDYLVPLPIQGLYASFQAGRPCLRLSQIHQTAPYLFNRELMAGEDHEVALPYQKVRRILEAAGMPVAPPRANGPEQGFPQKQDNPFTHAAPEAAPERNIHSPFMPPPQQEILQPQDNPYQFNAPQPNQSPFQVATPSPFQNPAPVVQPSTQPAMTSSHLPPPKREQTPGTPSPFQVMPANQGNSPLPPAGMAPPSPFAVSQRLPNSEIPPAYPAPVSSSPFLVAQPHQPAPNPPSAQPPAPPHAEPPPMRNINPPILVRSEPPQSTPAQPQSHQPQHQPAQNHQDPQSEPATTSVTLRLRSVLASAPVNQLGFDPVNVPDAVSVQFPIDVIAPQLASGRVTVQLADLVSGVAEKFRPAFSRAQPGMSIDLPLQDLLQALPKGFVPAPPSPPTGLAPAFSTPFQGPALEDASRIQAPPAPVVLPPLLRPSPKQREEEPAFHPAPISHLAAHEDLGQPRDPQSLTTAPPENLPLRGLPPAPLAEIDIPKITPPIGILPAPPQLHPTATMPPQRRQEIHQPAAPQRQVDSQDLQFGHQERPELLSLRHLLDCPPGLTPDQLIEKVASLPGIRAALLINAQGQQNGGDQSVVPSAFYDSAAQSHHSLKMLAQSMGLPPEGCFTLRADQMVRTFVLDGTVCLAVLHSQPEFFPGIKDKLILVTREVAKLCA